MLRGELKEALDKIAFDIKRIVQFMMESGRGINQKINENTLIDSHIYEELDITQDDIGLYTLFINDYVQFIESGMWPGHWVDEKYLLPWMADKGIPTDNETLRKIQGSIYWLGIEPRPFMDAAFDRMDEFWDEWADALFEAICKELDYFFD